MSYDAAFFAEESRVALSAAGVVLPGVLEATGAKTVVDVGCGTGAWLSVAHSLGCGVMGFDQFAPLDQLLIDEREFQRWDLDPSGYGVLPSLAEYDLSICLEVAEHLPSDAASTLVRGLCTARYVLFSGAHPGQRGVNHINEQWSTWWAELFAEHGYLPSIDIRWQHWNDQRVQDFYRENMIIFATEADLDAAGYSVGVFDVIHPVRLGKWAA